MVSVQLEPVAAVEAVAPVAPVAAIRAHMLVGRSENSWKAYESDLRLFVGAGGNEALAAFLSSSERAAQEARAWLQEMEVRGLGSSTRQRRIAALRAFVGAARDLGYVNWSLDLTVPAVSRSDSSHRKVVYTLIEDRLVAEPELVGKLVEILRTGPPEGLVAFVTQKRSRLNLYDAFVLFEVQTMLEQRKLVLTRIPVGAVPQADRSREVNRQALSKLPEPFKATVFVEHAEADGRLDWEGDSAPLEIGTTQSSRTYLHLHEAGALARWCYEDEYITLCVSDAGEGQAAHQLEETLNDTEEKSDEDD